jgi:hypothetical protein
VRTDRRTRTALIALAIAVLLELPWGRCLRGEDDWDAEGRGPDARAAAQQRGQFDVEANITSWICGSPSRTTAERKAESLLTLRVGSLERAGGLSKAQLEMLRLAARNDLACFFRKMDALKQECRGMNVNDEKFQRIWPKVDPLRAQFNAGLLDETSLFQKVLQGMSRRDPSAPWHEEERQRRRFRYRATIEVAVAMFEAGVPLTDVQRQKFLKVLFDELEPPKSIGRRAEYVVFYQASKLDEGKLRPIFDDAQWRALDQVFRSAQGMEQNLKTQGFVP